MQTHIGTLSIYTPKGRRRIRRTLGLDMSRMLTVVDRTRACMRARNNETKEGRAFLKMTEEEQVTYRNKSRFKG